MRYHTHLLLRAGFKIYVCLCVLQDEEKTMTEVHAPTGKTEEVYMLKVINYYSSINIFKC